MPSWWENPASEPFLTYRQKKLSIYPVDLTEEKKDISSWGCDQRYHGPAQGFNDVLRGDITIKTEGVQTHNLTISRNLFNVYKNLNGAVFSVFPAADVETHSSDQMEL